MNGHKHINKNEEIARDFQKLSKMPMTYYGKGGIADYLYLMTTHVLLCGESVKWLPGREVEWGWIYFILHEDILIYIGRARNLRRRLQSGHHVYNNKIHNLIFYCVFGNDINAETEAINTYWPALNYNNTLQKRYKAEVSQ
jgi:hypothetical protein